jgi:hypothetical protein
MLDRTEWEYLTLVPLCKEFRYGKSMKRLRYLRILHMLFIINRVYEEVTSFEYRDCWI